MSPHPKSMSKLQILIAINDHRTRVFLGDNLTADGAVVITVGSCREALREVRIKVFDIVIADVNGDTLDLVDWIHARVPLLVLAAANELDTIRALQRGADDVMGKPFSYPEMAARIGAIVRRQQQRDEIVYVIGDLRVDLTGRTAMVGDQAVSLSRREFQLLAVLASDPTRVWAKAELMDKVWAGLSSSSRTLDSHACRLRNALKAAGLPHVPENVWGVGYKLCAVPAALLATRGVAS